MPKAQLCITDLSTASSSPRPLTSKTILWGDEGSNTISYPSNENYYTYTSAARKLPFLLEVSDNQGCKAQDAILIDVFWHQQYLYS